MTVLIAERGGGTFPACMMAGFKKSMSAAGGVLPSSPVPACKLAGFEMLAANWTCRETVSRCTPSRRAIARCDQP